MRGELQSFDVVMNGEEQYSIWPIDKALPHGWLPVGMRGSKEACLQYISKHWTDMRPLSVRRHETRDISGKIEANIQ